MKHNQKLKSIYKLYVKTMKQQNGFFEGRENKKLFYQNWLPDDKNIKAYIIAIHGWGGHSDRLRLLAENLTNLGYGIYAFDLRGHWRNAGDYPGHIESMDHIQKDIVLFKDMIAKEVNGKKIFLLGQSFGALISLLFAIKRPDLHGVILSSPLLEFSKGSSLGKKMAKKLSAKISPEKTIPYEIDQKDLTSDIKILRTFIADKHRLDLISAKSFDEMNKSMKWAMEHASELLCPCLIMQAGSDRIGLKEKTEEFVKKIRSKDKTYKEYDGFLHDLLNEKRRAQIFQDLWIWIESHL